jgi:hypothetical protein
MDRIWQENESSIFDKNNCWWYVSAYDNALKFNYQFNITISQLTQTALEHWSPARYSDIINGNNAAHKFEMYYCSERTLPRLLVTAGN